MDRVTARSTMEEARLAAERGEWQEAYDRLESLDRAEPLQGADVAFLAAMAYATGRLDATIAAWERTHVTALAAGEVGPAAEAAVRVAMHLLFDTGLMAPVRGWLARAERVLDGARENPAFAWMAVVRSYERLLSGDPDSAQVWATHAVDVGGRNEPGAAAVGRIADARIRILQGEVDEGLQLLNEAAVSSVSGELDPLTTGVVYCEVVCALQALAQYDLAEQWTVAMERWRQGRPVGSIHGRCRVHRAEILRLRGSTEAAEKEAEAACRELRPYLHRELGWPLTELGTIRLRRGDLEGAAEAFGDAEDHGWDPQPGFALLQLARGDVDGASSSIREALERPRWVPSKELPPNTDLRRAPLLEAKVRIEVAAGRIEEAHKAAEELDSIARRYRSRALQAAAHLARARSEGAAGQRDAAREQAGRAHVLWSEIGAPYEAAEAQAELEKLERADETRDAVAKRASVRVAAASECRFFREADHWLITFEGRSTRLHDLKGLGYLAQLLSRPGRSIPALALGTSGSEELGYESRESDAGPLLDDQAKTAYERRLREIDDDLDLAREAGDSEREAQALTERDILARELARAVGLGDRRRRSGSAAERARSRVTQAVRRAIGRISEHHPSLGDHLDHAVRTGVWCSYTPDPSAPRTWEVRHEAP